MSSSLRMQDKNILDHYSDLSVGDVFARSRKAAGLTLEQAAAETMISLNILQALEGCQKEHLPSRVYTIGFVRSYAEFLRLDPDKMVYLYDVQVLGLEEHYSDPAASSGKKKKQARTLQARLPALAVLAMISGTCLIIGAFGYISYRLISYESVRSEPVFKQESPSLDDYMIPLPQPYNKLDAEKD